VNEEFHDDPLTEYIAPPRPYTGNRDIFVFVDTGEELRSVAITGYSEVNLKRFFESPDEPRPASQVLPELYAVYSPQRIALNMDGRKGMTRSLTYATYGYLSDIMGPEATSRFVSAADLIEEYLDTRIPEELEAYRNLVHLTEVIAKRALSDEVIEPGVTTIGDVDGGSTTRCGSTGWAPGSSRTFGTNVAEGRTTRHEASWPWHRRIG